MRRTIIVALALTVGACGGQDGSIRIGTEDGSIDLDKANEAGVDEWAEFRDLHLESCEVTEVTPQFCVCLYGVIRDHYDTPADYFADDDVSDAILDDVMGCDP